MKLGTPTTNLPPHSSKERGKYAKIYEAIRALRGNNWLPVLFDSDKDAYNFRVAATQHRREKLEVRLRGSSVYVRIQQPAKNGKPKRSSKRRLCPSCHAELTSADMEAGECTQCHKRL